MANTIVEEFQKLQETLTAERENNETKLTAIQKSHETTVAETEAKAAKMDEAIAKQQAAIKAFEDEKAKDRARIEMLEAMAERPAKTADEVVEDEYNTAFYVALSKGFKDPYANAELTQKGEALQKDVTIGTNAGGGFGLPKQIGATVDALLLELSDVMNHVKTLTVGTSDYQELVSIHGGTSGWVAETGTRSATGTPNLRSQKPTWGELYAYPQVSEWSLQDIQFDVTNWLTNDIAEGMSQALSLAIWSGDGSDKPTGMTNGAPVTTDDHASPLRSAVVYEYIPTAGVSPILSGPGGDDFIDLAYQLNPRYRANARFAMNTVTQGVARKLKDSNGQYLWQNSLQLGQPNLLLGYPIFTWEDMGNPSSANALTVAFGDFAKAYLLTNRVELRIDSEGVTNPGYIRFYVRRRYGGFPLNNDAVKFLKAAAS